MIIVSGKIYLRSGAREDFLARSAATVLRARRTKGCLDFIVAADPVELDRVNVYEEWESEDALLRFRGDGPDEDLSSNIVCAKVARHMVVSSGSA